MVGVEREHAVLTTTRSSHVRIYETCPRQWYLHHATNYANCKSDAMTWGVTMHEILEDWFERGIPPPNTPHGRAARLSLQHLPAPGPGLSVEKKWKLSAAPYVAEYTGAIDLCDVTVRQYPEPEAKLLPPGIYYGHFNKFVQMWDHKSCSDVKWAKTPEELSQDISACAYAHYLCTTYNAGEVRCRWVYTQRDGKASVPVDFTITREQAAARWQKTMQSVAEMQAILKAAQPGAVQDIRGNLDVCDAYGGCHYRPTCHPAPDFVLAPPKQRATLPIVQARNDVPPEVKPMSKLLEKIRAQRASGAQPTAPQPDPINPPDAAPHNTPAPAAGDAALAAYTDKELLEELLRRA